MVESLSWYSLTGWVNIFPLMWQLNTYIFYSNTNNIYFIVTEFLFFFQNETKREIHDIYISDGEFADFHEHDNKIVPVSIWKADAKFVKSE